MRNVFLAAAALMLSASSVPAQPVMHPAPLHAAESFTRDEASRRFEAGGFSDVRSLMKDGRGVWHARARQHGQGIDIWLDSSGRVVTRAP